MTVLVPHGWAFEPLTSRRNSSPPPPAVAIPLSHLEEWLRIPIQPLRHISEVSEDVRRVASPILRHLGTGTSLHFTYDAGTTPGRTRNVTPIMLFHKIENPYILTDQPAGTPPAEKSEPTYLLARCHLRKQTRTFRLDRINIETTPKHCAHRYNLPPPPPPSASQTD